MWRGIDGTAEFDNPRDAERPNVGEVVAKNSEAELTGLVLLPPLKNGPKSKLTGALSISLDNQSLKISRKD